MYTPRLNTRRWFGSHNAPATRPDNERQGAAYAPVVQLHDEIDRLFDGMFRDLVRRGWFRGVRHAAPGREQR